MARTEAMIGQGSFDIDPTAVVRDCYVLYKKTANQPTLSVAISEHLQRVKSCLAELLLCHAKIYALHYRQWQADDNNPGYLVSTVPGIYCRVPVHIVPLFPDAVEFQQFAELAREIRVSQKSIICLSGSNTFGRAVDQINDVDLCEYIPIENSDFSHCEYFSDTEDIFIASSKVAGSPWVDSDTPPLQQVVDLDDDKACRGKSEFIYINRKKTAVELTNVLLFCDRSFGGVATNHSFAAQQAPMDLVDIPPNELADPHELGRYIEFLVSQIEKYIGEGDLIKALKRSLSLSRILFASETTNEILDLIDNNTFVLSKEIEKSKSLRKQVDVLKSKIGEKRAKEILDNLDIYIKVKETEYKLRSDSSPPSRAKDFEKRVKQIHEYLLRRLGIKKKTAVGTSK